MHYGRRSDLALEAKELFESSAGKTTQLSGVRAREETLFGYPLTRVDILDETGAEALGKPVGTYLTLEFPALPQGRAYRRPGGQRGGNRLLRVPVCGFRHEKIPAFRRGSFAMFCFPRPLHIL